MKRRHETVRLANLELLVGEAGSAAALARLANTSESYLSQIRNQLTTAKGTPRGVGDDLAAKLERAMGKPNGWMDESHREITGTDEPASRNPEAETEVRGLHPLISWAQAGVQRKMRETLKLRDAEDLIPCPIQCSQDTFVLRIRGESMEPKFHDGDLIFVDPQISPTSGRFVIVFSNDFEEPTLKQLILEEGRRYLKALNPDWPNRISEMDANATIIGVAVFKGEVI